jgi:hypothetical protein
VRDLLDGAICAQRESAFPSTPGIKSQGGALLLRRTDGWNIMVPFFLSLSLLALYDRRAPMSADVIKRPFTLCALDSAGSVGGPVIRFWPEEENRIQIPD